jgi:hypothetical protein
MKYGETAEKQQVCTPFDDTMYIYGYVTACMNIWICEAINYKKTNNWSEINLQTWHRLICPDVVMRT